MKITALMYKQSHCDMPDIEDMEVEIENNKCRMTYAEDVDDYHGQPCRGKIKWVKKEGWCNDCQAYYLRD